MAVTLAISQEDVRWQGDGEGPCQVDDNFLVLSD